ncbi:MAG: hypothetical protein JWQ55_2704 [Rhodopila sp.]|nr:hypothetical protein [Rhodopila sp.]
MNRKQRLVARKPKPITQPVSPALQRLLAEGLQHHLAGRLSEAERLYRQILAINPRHADGLHLLGMIAYQAGHPELAVDLIGKAITTNANVASYHSNLGNALKQLGRLDQAAAAYRGALGLMPNFMEAHYNLGNTFREQGRLDDAVACYRKALALKPDFAEAHNNLGRVLEDQGRLDEAVACCRRALDLKPNFPEAHYNLGRALEEQERLDDAAVCYRKALDLQPDLAEAHNNLGAVLGRQGHSDDAIAGYRRALELKPDLPGIHNNLALALLAQGDMAAGWQEHEWRWKTPQLIEAHRDFAQPQWQGQATAGRTLLIHAEQGFGDTLQFCRYASLAAGRGLRVIMEVQRPLVRLLRDLPGVDLVLGHGDELPAFDLHCPMLSMPLALGTTLETIPGAAPYLHADQAGIAAWRTRLAAMANQNPRVGLVWAGNPRRHSPALAAADRRRSLALDRLAPLFDLRGLHFFGLQKDAPSDLPLTDFMGEMEDFADTAALIANLDLVIAVDTAVAHLSAALGKPVWLLNRFDSCWRWLTGRRDSPWYPGLRLYQQPRPGDWDPVLAEVASDLRDFAERFGRTDPPVSRVS